jgi:hypothetical protein
MKRYLAIIFIVSGAGLAFAQQPAANAQQQPEIGEPNANVIQGALPQEALKEISIDKFEQEGYWHAYISTDSGFATSRLFTGGPQAKKPLEGETELGMSDNNVLGTKIDFLRRGHTSIYINATRPIPVEGITKTITIWAAGRNYNHKLYLIVEDARGRYFELYMGRLNFQGWKQMAVPIPPQTGDYNSIIQTDYHYSSYLGIRVVGFRVDVDPMEAYGTYYLYFDDLRAVTDLFVEDSRDPDDPHDDW